MNGKKIYNIIGFIMSIYLLVITIVTIFKVKLPYMNILETIAYFMLAVFFIELIIVYSKYKNKREFFLKEWVSITAVMVSVSFAGIFYFIADWGFIGAAKVAKAFKVVNGSFFAKLGKVGKSSKAIKSAKLYKKVVKE